MARKTSTALAKANNSSRSQKTPKKADLIEAAIRAGVPANRLKGTIPQIQAEVREYLNAQAEAAADVADAALAPQKCSATTTQQPQSRIHPMNGVYIGGALAALWHFLG